MFVNHLMRPDFKKLFYDWKDRGAPSPFAIVRIEPPVAPSPPRLVVHSNENMSARAVA